MRHLLSILALAALLLWSSGCASQLQTTIKLANILGGPAVAAGTQLNKDFAEADKACLWTPAGAPSPLQLDTQAQCLAKTRAAYGPALKVYKDLLAVWTPFDLFVHIAEAQELLGREVDMTRILALLPDVLRLVSEMEAAYAAIVAPPLPPLPVGAPVKAVP